MSDKDIKRMKKINPLSEYEFVQLNIIEERKSSKKKNKVKALKIEKPWGDEGIYIFIESNSVKKIANIIMPSKLIAIYHQNKESIEYIFDCVNEEYLKK